MIYSGGSVAVCYTAQWRRSAALLQAKMLEEFVTETAQTAYHKELANYDSESKRTFSKRLLHFPTSRH